MVKVMMYGCNGYMGHVICNLIKDMENVTVAAGIDPCPGDQKDFPVFTSLDACDVDVDVIIDFSAAVAVDGAVSQEKTFRYAGFLKKVRAGIADFPL